MAIPQPPNDHSAERHPGPDTEPLTPHVIRAAIEIPLSGWDTSEGTRLDVAIARAIRLGRCPVTGVHVSVPCSMARAIAA